ncbi:hypothetical protein Prum_002870 [Phytohabitans rumicis]|uniref:Orc1-like AAA ATPase domain-containing protein n=1 Tax=Phytohabitans rumicis TaxID=1076125 RepID=A0A6V8L1P6_9ACTN|nr:AAA family ATPase [Phytohabitans rumicis]GFJ86645.1 hypothetical protein Prum_002870 [Phytohabitans rumicis]
MSEPADRPPLLIFPIGIGTYDEPTFETLDVEPQIRRLCDLLAPFGGRQIPWAVPMDGRGGTAVLDRLQDWSSGHEDHDTVLYWIGHGWDNTVDASLAHRESPAVVDTRGLLPKMLAGDIVKRQNSSPRSWTMVVVDACSSARFAQLVNAILEEDRDNPRRILLIGVSGEGATRLGAFTMTLDHCLNNVFRANTVIELHDLAGQLEQMLTDSHIVARAVRPHALVRTLSPAATLPIVVDIQNEIRALPTDTQLHFLPKARGGETSETTELPWFFEGREAELRRIATWLRDPDRALLVVTGNPGTGKSALLGQVLARTHPDLIAALVDADLVEPIPADQQPPPNAFAASILLTGLTVEDTIRRLADDLRLGPPPAVGTTEQLSEWLETALGGKAGKTGRSRLTLMLDALDEAQEPVVLANLLARLGGIANVYLIVGTRRSSRARIDVPDAPDEDLLDALLAGPATHDVVDVKHDPDALSRYVGRRLTAIFGGGHEAAAQAVGFGLALRGQEFLFARLAVHELAARPELVTSGQHGDLTRLLGGDHGTLFAAAVHRLTQLNPAYRPLLYALAYGLGRGLPMFDQTWATVASALGDPAAPPAATDFDNLVAHAAPYLMVDSESGQTVYRFAHRSFQEHLQHADHVPARERHAAILDALLRAADRAPDPLNAYLVRHLSGHAAEAGIDGLRRLDQRPDLVDRLDPRAVAFDALRTGVSPSDFPPTIVGVVAAQHHIVRATTADRTGLRQLAMARQAGTTTFAHERPTPDATWTVRWARFASQVPHITLTGHIGPIRALTVLSGPDGQPILASAGYDTTVPLWDAVTGERVDSSLIGHPSRITKLASLPQPGRPALLASGGVDATIRLWNPATGRQIGPPLRGDAGQISALTAVPGPADRALLASVSDGGTAIWLWDPVAGRVVHTSPTGHTTRVVALTVVPDVAGRPLLATAGEDATIRIWDPRAGRDMGGGPLNDPAGQPDDERPAGGRIWALAAVPYEQNRHLIACAGDDTTIQLWDPETGRRVGAPLTGHTQPVTALAVLPGPDGKALLASAGDDATIRLRDPVTGRPFGAPLTGHTLPVTALAVVPAPHGRPLLASASKDSTIRLWDPTAAMPTNRPALGHTGKILALTTLSEQDTDLLVSAGEDTTIQVWDGATGRRHGEPLTGHTRPVTALAVLRDADGRTLLASAGDDATIRVWDAYAGRPVGSPMPGQTGWIRALAAVPGPAGNSCWRARATTRSSESMIFPPAGRSARRWADTPAGSGRWPLFPVWTARSCSPVPATTPRYGCGSPSAATRWGRRRAGTPRASWRWRSCPDRTAYRCSPARATTARSGCPIPSPATRTCHRWSVTAAACSPWRSDRIRPDRP